MSDDEFVKSINEVMLAHFQKMNELLEGRVEEVSLLVTCPTCSSKWVKRFSPTHQLYRNFHKCKNCQPKYWVIKPEESVPAEAAK